MIKVSADTRAIDRIVKKFSTLPKRFRDLRAPLKQAGLYMMREFTNRIDRSGPGWKELSPVTKLLRIKGRGVKKFKSWSDVEAVQAKPLADTGRLRQSLTAKRAEGNVFVLTRMSVQAGTNVEYAARAMGLEGPQPFVLPPGWYGRIKKNTTKDFRRTKEQNPIGILKKMEREGKSYKIPVRNPVFINADNRRRIKEIFFSHATETVRKHFKGR